METINRLQGRIHTIKETFPKIFSRDNIFKSAINATTDIIGSSPYEFSTETTAIKPFNRIFFRYITYETPEGIAEAIPTVSNMKKRWKLNIGFVEEKENSGLDDDLSFSYIGNRDDLTGQPQQNDKLLINFSSKRTKIFFDLKSHKIGFANNSDKVSYKISDYSTIIDFDQLDDQDNLLLNFNQNSSIKISRMEFGQEKNIVAFICKSRLFGKDERIITLPLIMEVQPNKMFSNLSIVKDLENVPKVKETPTVIDDKKLVIINRINNGYWGSNQKEIISIDELKFTLKELKILFFKYKLKLNDPEIFEIMGFKQSQSIKNYMKKLVIRNPFPTSKTKDSILKIFSYAETLGILDKNFIQKLEQAIESLKSANC